MTNSGAIVFNFVCFAISDVRFYHVRVTTQALCCNIFIFKYATKLTFLSRNKSCLSLATTS